MNFWATVTGNSIMLSFSLLAYRRTHMPAFVFWIAAGGIDIILPIAMETLRAYRAHGEQAYRVFMICWRLGYIIEAALATIGTVMIIQHILKNTPPPIPQLLPTSHEAAPK
jgi:hypothetical protein